MSNKVCSIAFLIFSVVVVNGCRVYEPITDLSGQTIKGIIVDGDSGEPFVGYTGHEYQNEINAFITGIEGEFELTFSGAHPVAVLTSCFDVTHVEMTMGEVNEIVLDKKIRRRSQRLVKKLKRGKE